MSNLNPVLGIWVSARLRQAGVPVQDDDPRIGRVAERVGAERVEQLVRIPAPILAAAFQSLASPVPAASNCQESLP